MNRLRDDAGSEPVSERGIELLRGTPPAPRMQDVKRRVWTSLQRSQVRAMHTSGVSRIRAFALVVVVVCVAGSAAAMIAHRLVVPHHDPAAQKPQASPVAGKQPARFNGAVRSTKPAPTEVAVAMNDVARPVVGKLAGPRRVAAPAAEHLAPSAATEDRPAMVGAATAREQAEVLDAMIALRRSHDATRAGALLDRYLTAHPHGALREEALVLAIEAAGERGERALAQTLARTYQTDYPGGRFRKYASDHAAPSGP
jgi:hypothetical protein